MKLLQELLEALDANARKAMDLGRSTGKAGKPMAKRETIEANLGPEAWKPYTEGYREGERMSKDKDAAGDERRPTNEGGELSEAKRQRRVEIDKAEFDKLFVKHEAADKKAKISHLGVPKMTVDVRKDKTGTYVQYYGDSKTPTIERSAKQGKFWKYVD